MKHDRTFQIERATKNAVVFQEIEIPGQLKVIGQLYVQKAVFNGSKFPEKIRITLDTE